MSIAPRQSRTGDCQSIPAQRGLVDFARSSLTPRECEVMHWINEGKRDREIATILGLSPRTVEKHVSHILEKLKVETRTAAVNQCRHSLALSQAAFGDAARTDGTPRSQLKGNGVGQRYRRSVVRKTASVTGTRVEDHALKTKR